MTYPIEYSFIRYLQAKKSIDDRSLNRRVWGTLARAINKPFTDKTIRVIELGAGLGSMIQRAFDWGLFQRADYTAIEANRENTEMAIPDLKNWAQSNGYEFISNGENQATVKSAHRSINIKFVCDDIFEFIPRNMGGKKWDLIICHAFLDLLDLQSSLPEILNLGHPDGLFYFSINFDGVSIIEPEIEAELDATIIHLYHQSMDERLVNKRKSGDSRTGRRLFHHLNTLGAEILDAGASDWVVFAKGGKFENDEQYFLHFIIHTIFEELHNHPNINASEFQRWINIRHEQIEHGELAFIAHQLDFCGKISKVV